MTRKKCLHCGRIVWEDIAKCPNCRNPSFISSNEEYPSSFNHTKTTMKNKITHIAWLDAGCIGVVRVESEYDPPTYYIQAVSIQAISQCFIRREDTDAISVAHWGYKISDSIGESIIKEYGKPFEIEFQ